MADPAQKSGIANTAADDAAGAAPAETLAAAFERHARQAAAQHTPLRPTLAKLSAIVSQFQAIGKEEIGIELATFDRLREYGLSRQDGSFDSSHFCILSIYDARFLVRVYPAGRIDAYPDNLNKPAYHIQSPDSDAFNYFTERNGSQRINKAEPKFTQYDLSKEEDAAAFTQAIVQTAAYLSSYNDLREFDLPPSTTAPLPKSRRLRAGTQP